MRKNKFLKQIAKLTLCAAIGFSAFTLGSAAQVHAATPQSLKLISTGENYLGTPYKYGAPAGVTYAFDCSSFTQFLYNAFDVSLPRTALSQSYKGEKVPKTELSTGDLVFFKTNGSSISHVAIYAGNQKILHSSSSQGVTLSSMNTSYWQKYYVTARRVL
ncbi:C40 family peptidase [Paenibacillus protaetiae]|uniref:NlpC/P60 family protein n=1 Tax=Paenibacillus protaetiae TaxID=2509456 RepID=A0A4P6EU70_9BACL|nr:C40 family peptidase [Paenibacillus protaetiae]QAY66464.1 NlpC/P60 family protein [Paenibacillus protaetiae]